MHLSTSAGAATHSADLLDISRGGAKLAVGQYVPVGVTLTICFHDLQVAATATVCWSRKEAEDRWWMACEFHPALPDNVLEKLLGAGSLERRKHAREPIAVDAVAKWQGGESSPIVIRDLSAGGLCLSSDRGGQRGQRLLLRLTPAEDAQAAVLTEVQWQIKFNDGYLIGCSFLNRQGLAAVRKLVPVAGGGDATQPHSALSRRLWSPFGRLLSLWKGEPAEMTLRD